MTDAFAEQPLVSNKTSNGNSIVVPVGHLAVTEDSNALLSTYALGTCIGLVVYDCNIKVAGLLHFMLPDSYLSPKKAKERPSMFADVGIVALLEQLRQINASVQNMKICLVGGASCLTENDIFKIGEKNLMAAHEVLSKKGLKVDFEDCGGRNNRSLCLEVKTGLLTTKTTKESKTIDLNI